VTTRCSRLPRPAIVFAPLLASGVLASGSGEHVGKAVR
jgi:hypothetical protein